MNYNTFEKKVLEIKPSENFYKENNKIILSYIESLDFNEYLNLKNNYYYLTEVLAKKYYEKHEENIKMFFVELLLNYTGNEIDSWELFDENKEENVMLLLEEFYNIIFKNLFYSNDFVNDGGIEKILKKQE